MTLSFINSYWGCVSNDACNFLCKFCKEIDVLGIGYQTKTGLRSQYLLHFSNCPSQFANYNFNNVNLISQKKKESHVISRSRFFYAKPPFCVCRRTKYGIDWKSSGAYTYNLVSLTNFIHESWKRLKMKKKILKFLYPKAARK